MTGGLGADSHRQTLDGELPLVSHRPNINRSLSLQEIKQYLICIYLNEVQKININKSAINNWDIIMGRGFELAHF
jgi:hypothetical protein